MTIEVHPSIQECVPTCPITVTSESLDGMNERRQVPKKTSSDNDYIHKRKGLTLSKTGIDITEKTVAISYVAISRVKVLSSCIIKPMTFEWLSSLKQLI